MISLAVPTRARPERFAEMYRSALETADGDVEVSAVLDEDDETRKDYPKGPIYTIVPEGPVTTDLWNVAAYASHGEYVMLAADDILFRTKGWDTQVSEAFESWPDHIGMVYGNDLHLVNWKPPVIEGWDPGPSIEGTQITQRGRTQWLHRGGYVFPTHPFLSREWITAAKMFTPPYFHPTWEADAWIFLLAQELGRMTYLEDTVIEHMHPMAGKAPMDDSYRAGSWAHKELWDAAKRINYSGQMAAYRAKQIGWLRAAMREPVGA